MSDVSLPKIKIRKTGFDTLLEFLSLLAIFATVGFITYYYSSLPEKIPIYYNWPTKINGLGDKSILWTCPVFSAGIAFVINRLCLSPWILNYPVKVTRENAETNYTMATGMLRMLGTVITLAFLSLSLMSIFAGLGSPLGIESHFLIAFSVLMVGIPLGYIIILHLKI